MGDQYTAHTLLSWDEDTRSGIPANSPDPTYQTLTGTYGGTWSSKTIIGSNNQSIAVDDTEVKWNGATPAGIYSVSPTPSVPDIRTTVYPSTSTGGKMPTADLSTCAKKEQSWSYTVTDKGPNDGAVLTPSANGSVISPMRISRRRTRRDRNLTARSLLDPDSRRFLPKRTLRRPCP